MDRKKILTCVWRLDGDFQVVALDQRFIAEGMFVANLGCVFHACRNHVMKVPETVMVIGHFLGATMLLDLFSHLVAAQDLADRFHRKDLEGKDAEEQYGQKFSHDLSKDKGISV